MTTAHKMNIQEALLQVAAAMEKAGISKASETKAAGRYKYRGIDAALNALSRPLVDAGVTVSPSYKLISSTEIKTKEGVGYLTTVEGSITFHAPDNSVRTVGPFIGQAFDSLDKGATKAMSIAYRTGMFLTFVIPLGPGHDTEEGDNEVDASANDWLELIAAAKSQDTLARIAKDLKADKDITPAALKTCRAAWAAKSKEIKS
jgi:ERF superfamily